MLPPVDFRMPRNAGKCRRRCRWRSPMPPSAGAVLRLAGDLDARRLAEPFCLHYACPPCHVARHPKDAGRFLDDPGRPPSPTGRRRRSSGCLRSSTDATGLKFILLKTHVKHGTI